MHPCGQGPLKPCNAQPAPLLHILCTSLTCRVVLVHGVPFSFPLPPPSLKCNPVCQHDGTAAFEWQALLRCGSLMLSQIMARADTAFRNNAAPDLSKEGHTTGGPRRHTGHCPSPPNMAFCSGRKLLQSRPFARRRRQTFIEKVEAPLPTKTYDKSVCGPGSAHQKGQSPCRPKPVPPVPQEIPQGSLMALNGPQAERHRQTQLNRAPADDQLPSVSGQRASVDRTAVVD